MRLGNRSVRPLLTNHVSKAVVGQGLHRKLIYVKLLLFKKIRLHAYPKNLHEGGKSYYSYQKMNALTQAV
jgi:hypothetical protein